MIRQRDRIEVLKNKLDSFKAYRSDKEFICAMDCIEVEISDQLSKFVKID